MQKGKDIAITFKDLYLVHHNIPGKEVDFHSHDEHLLFIPLQGEMSVFLKEETLQCGPGRMIYMPASTEHRFESSSHQGERLIALISPQAWKKAKAPKQQACVVAASQLCKEILFYLLLHPKTPHSASLLLVLIQTLSESFGLQNTVTMDHLESVSSDPRLVKLLDYFKSNLEDTVSMSKAASYAGLSIRSLNRLCLDHLKMTPKAVLIQYRIQKAKDLLSGGQHSVTDVALSVGYNSLASFIEAFRNVTGQLPSEFKRLGQKP